MCPNSRVVTCRALGDTRPTLFRHSFGTLSTLSWVFEIMFGDVVPRYDGSNINLVLREAGLVSG
eukprot:6012230-Pyramimonas_sp.AAC.1